MWFGCTANVVGPVDQDHSVIMRQWFTATPEMTFSSILGNEKLKHSHISPGFKGVSLYWTEITLTCKMCCQWQLAKGAFLGSGMAEPTET